MRFLLKITVLIIRLYLTNYKRFMKKIDIMGNPYSVIIIFSHFIFG